MQPDFLAKLTPWTRQPGPAKRPKSATDEEVALTAQACELLLALGCGELATRIRVRWNPRMRTNAGLAGCAHSLVTLNPKLAQFGEEEIDKTLRHELAHLLAQYREKRRRIAPHGAEWKQACRDLGLPDEKRCHNLPLPRRNMPAKHIYRCPVCKLDIKRVRPFRRGVACLACCRAHNRGKYHDKFRLIEVDAAAPSF